MRNRICENPKHEGDPRENHGEGFWWWKDPEWLFWCPNCSKRWFKELFEKEMNAQQDNSELRLCKCLKCDRAYYTKEKDELFACPFCNCMTKHKFSPQDFSEPDDLVETMGHCPSCHGEEGALYYSESEKEWCCKNCRRWTKDGKFEFQDTCEQKKGGITITGVRKVTPELLKKEAFRDKSVVGDKE